jgi:hypothetical protein
VSVRPARGCLASPGRPRHPSAQSASLKELRLTRAKLPSWSPPQGGPARGPPRDRAAGAGALRGPASSGHHECRRLPHARRQHTVSRPEKGAALLSYSLRPRSTDVYSEWSPRELRAFYVWLA